MFNFFLVPLALFTCYRVFGNEYRKTEFDIPKDEAEHIRKQLEYWENDARRLRRERYGF